MATVSEGNVKSELERLTEMNIITPVDTPTDWISSLVVVAKSDKTIRLCIDPKPLNRALKRNDYAMPTIEDVLPELQGARYFTHLDAKNGFWHVQLDEDSSFLTTFETPFEKYRWLRMPFGVSPAPEEFQRRIDVALQGLQSVIAVHDDIIVWGSGATDQEASEDHDHKLRALLQRCRDVNLKLNRNKVELKQTQITYLGHIISSDGLRADPKKIDAVKQIPAPVDKAGVQRLLGMVAYLQNFAPNISNIAAPLRELVKTEVNFRWDEHRHGDALRKVKEALSEPPVLRYFDTKEETTLQCDASEKGLGACLMQKGQPIQYASRALTETEQNYAQIEKEMLSIVIGLNRFEKYVYGRHIVVETDHMPLVTIHKKSLLSAPKRLQRMLLRTQMFDYSVVYKKGVEMYMADTLSRAFNPEVGEHEMPAENIFLTESEKEVEEINMIDYMAVSETRLNELQKATADDKDMCRLRQMILTGWPEDKADVPEENKKYFTFREEMSVQNGLIFKGDRIVVPVSMRSSIKERLHASHIGIQGCLRRARETVYWPNMNTDLEDYITRCATCNSIQRRQVKEPMIAHAIPELPWQHVACDLFECNGSDYVVLVDFYSDFFEVDRLNDKRGAEVIRKLKAHFARHRAPETLMSDNGPPFNSKDFADFANAYGFEHVTSSPGYPKSNGKAESAVKLLELRNVPTDNMRYSPVQRLFGRRTRTGLPIVKRLLTPQACTGVTQKLMERKERQTYYHDQGAKELLPLAKGQVVRFRPPGYKKWKKAVVEDQVDVRSYRIRTEDGRQYRRNRTNLRKTRENLVQTSRPAQMVETTDQQEIEDEPAEYSTTSVTTTEELTVEKRRPPQGPRPKSPDARPAGSQTSPVEQPAGWKMTPPRQTASGRMIKKPNFLKDFV